MPSRGDGSEPQRAPASPAWEAPDRFFVLGRLGQGAHGTVYRALDMVLGREVALKVLSADHDTTALFRFKREFRTLRDVVHPNLVRLYELFLTNDPPWFTMELVAGVPIHEHLGLRLGSAAGRGDTAPPPSEPRPAELERVRDRFFQLADAVAAIHATGKVHRDLKPSNVLVTAAGRVVVLDFGLISGDVRHGGDPERTHEASAVGTPGYMSPEQVLDQPLTSAADWYSVGVMLYEALTGVRPFRGTRDQVMARRVAEDPPPPRALVPTVPPELDAACMRLLDRSPARRGDGAVLLAALGRQPTSATRAVAERTAAPPFVGRAAELGALAAAFATARDGDSVVVALTGASGIGKTALVRHYLASLEPGAALVLTGRCHQRETVPYPAIETMVDALANALAAMPAERAAASMPRDVAALARLFPALARVQAVATARALGRVPADPAELRRRAVTACAELIQRLAGDRLPVVFLDDMQWSNADTAGLLGELVRYFVGTGALFVLSSRPLDTPAAALPNDAGTPTVRLTDVAQPSGRSPIVVRDLAVGPLDRAAAHALRAAIGADDAALDDAAAGTPFLLVELARHRAADAAAAPASLEQVLARRLAALDDDARGLLALAAVAARPLPFAIAAAGLGDGLAALTRLCSERLLVGGRAHGEWYVEPYHDRIRAAALAALPAAAAAALHARLAAELERLPAPPLDELVAHWRAAGEPARAAPHAERAALAAEASLAFRHAAAMYEVALAGAATPAHRVALRRRQAECHANVGRIEAALATLAAALPDATPAEAIALRRMQIEYALRSGDLRRGLADAQALCDELGAGVTLGRTAGAAKLLAEGLARRVRGFGFTRRTPEQVTDRERAVVDTLWSLTAGLAYVNPALARVPQLHLLDAARALGDPERVARVLCIEIAHTAHGGTKSATATAAVEAAARALCDELGRPELAALLEGGAGVAAALTGRWREADRRLRAAEAQQRDYVGVRWALNLVQFFQPAARWYLGDLAGLIASIPRQLAEAEELGDVHALGGLRTGRGNLYWLIVDRPADALAMAEAGFDHRTDDDEFHLHHYFRAVATAKVDLYRGDAARALATIDAAWPRLWRSPLIGLQLTRVEADLLHARAALAAAAAEPHDRAARLRVAHDCVQRVEREGADWAAPLTALARGHLAELRAEPARARAAYVEAGRAATAAGMAGFALAARARVATLVGGTAGAAEHAAVVAELQRRGAIAPVALLRLFGA